MLFSTVFAAMAIVAQVAGHGVLHSVQGSNKAVMPGLSIRDGTPRNNGFPTSGSEGDTSVIRKTEIGRRATPLGRTPNGGPVRIEKAMARYMGMGQMQKRQLNPGGLLNLFGIGGAVRTAAESIQSQTDGLGSMMGLPTTNDDGSLDMLFHQVNQDGAGPLTMEVDPVSAGSNDAAFRRVAVPQNVPGIVLGLSLESSKKWPIRAQMPPGTVCEGTVMGVQNVCVLRAKNGSPAGPFGGSVAFTQSPNARKRALEYRERKKRGEIVDEEL